jgi:hypothetical protein
MNEDASLGAWGRGGRSTDAFVPRVTGARPLPVEEDEHQDTNYHRIFIKNTNKAKLNPCVHFSQKTQALHLPLFQFLNHNSGRPIFKPKTSIIDRPVVNPSVASYG